MRHLGSGHSKRVCAVAAVTLISTMAIVAATFTAAAGAAIAPACSPDTTAQTDSGPVCGLTANGVTSYLGIPYAASPVGRLRWHSPVAPTPWTTPRQATTAGNICPGPSTTGGPVTGSEDCLTLNVQAPAGVRPGTKLPVMVEIHGGGFLDPIGPPDGSHLVTAGHVLYMAMNYRLGILGFMANRALGPHSGDYGLQDQQASLRWVKRNIAAFGGDPHNVTILGQSAGGASVCSQVASPTARNLFQRGIPRAASTTPRSAPTRYGSRPIASRRSRPSARPSGPAPRLRRRWVATRPTSHACARSPPTRWSTPAGRSTTRPRTAPARRSRRRSTVGR